jgi:hypothetical protein
MARYCTVLAAPVRPAANPTASAKANNRMWQAYRRRFQSVVAGAGGDGEMPVKALRVTVLGRFSPRTSRHSIERTNPQ